ncbi:MAG: hypothetical protein M0Q13_05530 [Methanothrix sp.]|nr:hypothetical protein [Methanothrix sp.]
MRKQIILVSILILWASAAHSAERDQATGLDILGSRANNTTIIAPDGMPIEVNIVGSTASNIQIGYPTEVVDKACGKECGPCGEEKRYETPWDDFKRPLCYPWSSYIPTRYSRSLIKKDPEYISTTPKILTLGSVTTKT